MSALKRAMEEAKILEGQRLEFQAQAKDWWEAVEAKLADFHKHVNKVLLEFSEVGFTPGSGGSLWKNGRKVAEAVPTNIGKPTGAVIRWEVSRGGDSVTGFSESVTDFDRDFGREMGRWL